MKTNKTVKKTPVQEKAQEVKIELLSSELNELQARDNIIRQLDADRIKTEYTILLVRQDISSFIKTLVTKHGLDETKAYTVADGMLVEFEEPQRQD